MAARDFYRVKKVFNNNVILAEKAEEKQEYILIAKGIGFSSKKGEEIDRSNFEIEKEFIPLRGEKRKNYLQLLEEVESKVVAVTEEIITMVADELEEDINQYIRIGLTDHIAFTLKRIRDGIEIANPFLAETRTLYNEEYSLAKKAVKMMEKSFNLKIPEAEVGFIAFHIHGARSNSEVSKTVQNTSLIKKLVSKVETEIGHKLAYQSLNYARLINHLRFALERIENNNDDNINPLLDNIKDNFAESFNLAAKLAEIIENRLDCKITEDEKGYLAIHLQRLKREVGIN